MTVFDVKRFRIIQKLPHCSPRGWPAILSAPALGRPIGARATELWLRADGYETASTVPLQGLPSRTIALRMVSSLRATAMIDASGGSKRRRQPGRKSPARSAARRERVPKPKARKIEKARVEGRRERALHRVGTPGERSEITPEAHPPPTHLRGAFFPR